MPLITLNKKEYKNLVELKKRLDALLKYAAAGRKSDIAESAFGVLKNNFGKKNSASHVAGLRKSWR